MSPPILQFQPDAGGGIAVDLERLVASRALIQANSGGGKSTLLRYLLEQTHGQIQHVVLDSEGEFATLRERHPYVLAGKGGDVAADPGSAKLLARRLMELGASAVIDLYDLKLQDRRRFVRIFLEELMHLPRRLWRPALIVIDEAHRYCPERGSGEAESTDAVTTLCTQGRKRGYCAVLATQRLSKLHKDAAAELLNVLIGRTGLDVDAKRAGDVLGFDKEQRTGLRRLDPGTWYAFGPAISQEVTLVQTGAIQTTHPTPGEVLPPAPPPPEELRRQLEQLQDLAEAAEEEERTIDGLKKRVGELERELRSARKAGPGPDPAELRDLRRQLQTLERDLPRQVAAAEKQLRMHIDVLDRRTARAAGGIEKAVGLLTAAAAELRNGDGPPPPVEVAAPQPRARPASSAPPARAAAEAPADVDADVSTPQARILATLASLEAIGLDQVDRSVVAVLSDQSPTSSGYSNNLGHLRNQLGLIDYPAGGMVQLTDAGRAVVGDVPAPASLDELWAAWKSKLSGPQGAILDALVEIYPDDIPRTELAERTGQSPTSSGYSNNLGRMRSLGVIDYPGPGRVAATALLFPEGLS